MKVLAILVTEYLQPLRKRTLAFAFSANEYAFSPQYHASTEPGYPAKYPASVPLVNIPIPAEIIDFASAVNTGYAIPVFLDNEYFLFFQITEN